MTQRLTEHELWLLSYYRISEISGAIFFGNLARSLRASPLQVNLTRHFADESAHAWYWSACIESLGHTPLKLSAAYQDQYASAAGLPANLMEILALTQVFEARVIEQYVRHSRIASLPVKIAETLQRIIADERWHIAWIRKALNEMRPRFGDEAIEEAVERYRRADAEVYRATLCEHQERVLALAELVCSEPDGGTHGRA